MEVGRGYIIRGPQFSLHQSAIWIHKLLLGSPNNGTIQLQIPGTVRNIKSYRESFPSAADLFFLAANPLLAGSIFWTHNSPPNAVSGTTIYNYTSNDYFL
jgi:hypothetical protein